MSFLITLNNCTKHPGGWPRSFSRTSRSQVAITNKIFDLSSLLSIFIEAIYLLFILCLRSFIQVMFFNLSKIDSAWVDVTQKLQLDYRHWFSRFSGERVTLVTNFVNFHWYLSSTIVGKGLHWKYSWILLRGLIYTKLKGALWMNSLIWETFLCWYVLCRIFDEIDTSWDQTTIFSAYVPRTFGLQFFFSPTHRLLIVYLWIATGILGH